MTTNKKPLARAIVFIDGNNFYHGMKEVGLSLAGLDYALFSQKLVCAREWVETRYYAGRVRQEGNQSVYRSQRRLLNWLGGFDRVSCHLGRLEKRTVIGGGEKLDQWLNALQDRPSIDVPARAVEELRQIAVNAMGPWSELDRWLSNLQGRADIDVPVHAVEELRQIVANTGTTWVEKAVDVMIATDMVTMAYENKYDVAYLISADGDFTPAVEKVQKTKRQVFVASPRYGAKRKGKNQPKYGARLAGAADTFIPLRPEFFDDCWRAQERE